ncbi:MAG: hypothetical protein P8N51_06675 [Pseudomonadales bacterium]|jgi:hypothetical protein|nr:hypothetical protein [Pseudomonadales bacterium]MDG1444576.1 hypothetical protein [Pseudomonadales bacterium]
MASSTSNNQQDDHPQQSDEDNIILSVDELPTAKDTVKVLEVRRKIEDILEARRLKKEFDFDF